MENKFDRKLLLLLLLFVSIGIGLIIGGIKVHDNYKESYNNYELCLNNLNCTKECSLRGCRIIGCDIFYCPREPEDLSNVLYVFGILHFIGGITILFCLFFVK